jgi:hypothetical protein
VTERARARSKLYEVLPVTAKEIAFYPPQRISY